MIEDFKLSPNFSFFELTKTSNALIQEDNREAALKYKPSLYAVAGLLECIRDGRALIVNSAFRCGALNSLTKGSSPTSQHPMGQAVDFHRPGEDPHKTFLETLAILKLKKLPFGQLIDESAKRDYGMVSWVHLSLGRDFWKPERCGEVLKKWDDEKGKAQYKLIEKVSQEA